jgi:glutathione S-transferase
MLTLVIGNKQLSSWSLRTWILLRHLGIQFREVALSLDTPQFLPQVRQYSPAGRVPVLIDGEVHVWDSLAIIEYANELSGGRAWPTDRAQRAHARAIAAEMHSGFVALRTHWPMQAASRNLSVVLPPAGDADVSRVDAIWEECRERHASQGPWLFGEYSAADAMYAPVVLRFNSYGARLGEYARHVLADPILNEWLEGAATEIAQEISHRDHRVHRE